MQHSQPRSDGTVEALAFHFDVTDSTNARARELARMYPGRVIIASADEQTAGRGRSGRDWCSPRGGAWFSVAVPMFGDADRYAPAPLAAGLAVIAVLSDVLSGDAVAQLEIKWPNDVLLNGAKVCGILCEQVLTDDNVHLEPTLIVGVGINVNLPADQLPSNPHYPATSLLTVAGRPLSVAGIIGVCARAIQHELAALESDALSDEQYRRLQAVLAWRGRAVSIGGITGTLQGVDRLGRAVVQLHDTRETTAFDMGDLHLRRVAGD